MCAQAPLRCTLPAARRCVWYCAALQQACATAIEQAAAAGTLRQAAAAASKGGRLAHSALLPAPLLPNWPPLAPTAPPASPSDSHSAMGIFDRLRGKREDAAAEVSSAEAAAAVSPSLDLTEHAAAPPAAAAPGPSARQQQFTKQFGVAASEGLYNPYEGARGGRVA